MSGHGETINQKIQWIKNNERTSLRHQVANKIEVWEYLKDKNLEQYRKLS